jgi:hypothetical protein
MFSSEMALFRVILSLLIFPLLQTVFEQKKVFDETFLHNCSAGEGTLKPFLFQFASCFNKLVSFQLFKLPS